MAIDQRVADVPDETNKALTIPDLNGLQTPKLQILTLTKIQGVVRSEPSVSSILAKKHLLELIL